MGLVEAGGSLKAKLALLLFSGSSFCWVPILFVPWSRVAIWEMVIPPLIGNPY